jgi:hypothetical protein
LWINEKDWPSLSAPFGIKNELILVDNVIKLGRNTFYVLVHVLIVSLVKILTFKKYKMSPKKFCPPLLQASKSLTSSTITDIQLIGLEEFQAYFMFVQ